MGQRLWVVREQIANTGDNIHPKGAKALTQSRIEGSLGLHLERYMTFPQ